MQKYKDKIGNKAPFVPFMQYWPTYDSMDSHQKAWYFYWRNEVRNNRYPDTDLSYIFVHIYELLSGCGWNTANDGYAQLMKLWQAYSDRFPKLDSYLYDWTYDFALLHNLDYLAPEKADIHIPSQLALRDLLIDKHSEDKPLKLPFALIDALCDYSIVGSKFYKDGNQLLMHEAIPRVVALADAALLKKKGKGVLAVYSQFNMGDTFSKPQDEKYDLPELDMSAFWNMIGSEELECLVFLYLQSKGYYIYSSTLKLSTAKFEAVLTYRDGSHLAYPQVKRNVALHVEDYVSSLTNSEDKVFLFTTSEDYGQKTHPQILCISREELENFMKNNSKILPSTITYWLEMLQN